MKRLVTVIAIGLALLACASTAGWAVPTNGNNSGTLTLHCGGGTVTVLALPGESSPVWQVDESGLIGTKYHVQSLDIRVYSTSGLTTEPAAGTSDPTYLFSITHEWGQKNGQQGTILECTIGPLVCPCGGTGFGDLVLVSR